MSFPRQTRPGPQVSSLLSTSGRPQQSPAARLGGPSVLCAHGRVGLRASRKGCVDPLRCFQAALHKRCSREAWPLVMTEG